MDFGHKTTQVEMDHGDHLHQFLPYDVLPNLQDRVVHLQCDDVVGEKW